MTKTEIINIGRDLILKAGLLKKPTAEQKKKFLKLLDSYEKKLSSDTSKYKQVILGFIIDIRSDIESGREINIDNIEDDEYLENYFVTKNEVNNFNSLIDEKSYKAIFDELHKKSCDNKKIAVSVKNIDTQFRARFKKLSQKNLSKNLLIFTQFERKLPIPALNRLIEFMTQHGGLGDEIIVINRLERAYKNFLRDFYNECLECLKSKKINYKFIRYEQKNGKLHMHLKCEDASRSGLRSGNPVFEYTEILKKM